MIIVYKGRTPLDGIDYKTERYQTNNNHTLTTIMDTPDTILIADSNTIDREYKDVNFTYLNTPFRILGAILPTTSYNTKGLFKYIENDESIIGYAGRRVEHIIKVGPYAMITLNYVYAYHVLYSQLSEMNTIGYRIIDTINNYSGDYYSQYMGAKHLMTNYNDMYNIINYLTNGLSFVTMGMVHIINPFNDAIDIINKNTAYDSITNPATASITDYIINFANELYNNPLQKTGSIIYNTGASMLHTRSTIRGNPEKVLINTIDELMKHFNSLLTENIPLYLMYYIGLISIIGILFFIYGLITRTFKKRSLEKASDISEDMNNNQLTVYSPNQSNVMYINNRCVVLLHGASVEQLQIAIDAVENAVDDTPFILLNGVIFNYDSDESLNWALVNGAINQQRQTPCERYTRRTSRGRNRSRTPDQRQRRQRRRRSIAN